MSAPAWTARGTAFSDGGEGGKAAWGVSSAIFVMTGGSPTADLAYSADGITWTGVSAFDAPNGGNSHDVAWSETLGLFVAVGYNPTTNKSIVTSPDGIAWTPQTNPLEAALAWMEAVCWSDALGLFIAGGPDYGGPGQILLTSPDGVTWSAQTCPRSGGNAIKTIASDPAGNLIAGGTSDLGYAFLMTSSDGVTWTDQAGVPFGGAVYGLIWSSLYSSFLMALGGGYYVLWLSIDLGVNWGAAPTLMDSASAEGYGIIESGSNITVVGTNTSGTITIISSANLNDWVTSVTSPYSGGAGQGGTYSAALDLLVVGGYLSVWTGGNVIASASGAFNPVPVARSRFFAGYPWRFVFTDTPSAGSDGSVTTTWADGLITGRTINLPLDAPSSIAFSVWPDDKRVNTIFAADGDPLIAQSNRLVYAFRREGWANGGPPWVCRAAAILMSPEDQGDPDIPLTHFVAHDPWQYLNARPAMTDEVGSLPGPTGFILYKGTPAVPIGVAEGNYLITVLLRNTIASEGPCFIDAGNGSRIGEGSQYADWGGTSSYAGTIEVTDPIEVNVQRGQSVADVWNAIVSAGNCDIVLTPIYDPSNREGYTHELNIYQLAGQNRTSAVFAWDMMNRSVATADRMHDGTPGNFFNKVQAYAGPGGFPVPAAGPATNAASVAKYLSYWLNSFQTTQDGIDPTGSQVLAQVQQQLVLHKQGTRTMTVTPTPERAPIPLLEYNLGDRVPFYATKRLRVKAGASFVPDPPLAQRVNSITIVLDDDGTERVAPLVLSPDWRDPPGGGGD
jgi:hypothetical protein